MELRFKTKRDTNGNTYALIIDTEKKTFKTDYNTFCYVGYVTISKAERRYLINELENNGFTKID